MVQGSPPAVNEIAAASPRDRPGVSPHRPRSRWRAVARALAAVSAAWLFWLLAVWPPPTWYRSHWPRETAFMAMRRWEGRTDTPRRYQPVALSRVAPAVRQAVLIGEDHRFREHSGVDFLAILEAFGYARSSFAWDNPGDRAALFRAMRQTVLHPESLRGASTITQQLAKNLYLSPSRNPFRKAKEAVTAWRLEAALGKDRILELYLNVVELGDNVWGVEAASTLYFHTSAARVNWSEAASLAATLPHPRTSNPVFRSGRMRWRRDMILERMGRGGLGGER